MSHVRVFASSFIKHGTAVLTGSIIAVVATYLPALAGYPSLPQPITIAVVASGLLVAAYRTWLDPYRVVSAFADGTLACVHQGRGVTRVSDSLMSIEFRINLINRTANRLNLDRFRIAVPDKAHLTEEAVVAAALRDAAGERVDTPLQLDAHGTTQLLKLTAHFSMPGGVPNALPFKSGFSVLARDLGTGTDLACIYELGADYLTFRPVAGVGAV